MTLPDPLRLDRRRLLAGAFGGLVVAGGARAAERAVYLTMRDGVRIAVDVVPAAAGFETRAPTLVEATRYGRADRDPARVAQLSQAGLHQVYADARGTGVSTGWRPIEFSEGEFQDLGELIDWIVRQPWSDGQVAFTGNSYAGDTSELATATGRPGLVGAVIRHSEFDVYRHLIFPGGVRNAMMLELWGRAVGEADLAEACLAAASACKGHEQVKPVDGDPDYVQARAALAQHQLNGRPDRHFGGMVFYDDVGPAGVALGDVGASARLAAIRAAATPTQVWGSWLDGGTAASAIERYQAAPEAPTELYLAPWTHGGGKSVDTFLGAAQPDLLPRAEQRARQLAYLQDRFAKRPAPRRIRYLPLGATTWKETPVWPPAGVERRRLHIGAQGLSSAAPATASTRYAVDWTATTGKANRWFTQLGGGEVRYPDRAAADRKLATFDSAPHGADLELVGRPAVTLTLSASRTDGALFVYLEDVGPGETVTYLTEGQLRLIHRKPGPHLDGEPTYRRADALPVIPGVDMTLTVLLAPVAARLRAGHRLRVAIGGADSDTFARYPPEGDLSFTFRHGPDVAAHLDLPVRPWTA